MSQAPPPDPRIESMLQQARHAARIGNLAIAQGHWEQVLRLAPDQPEALVQLAQAALAEGDLATAHARLQQATAAHPRLAIAHAYRARAHVASGDVDAALQSLDAAILHNPAAWGAYFEKAELLESLDRKREAALSWGAALGAMPRDAAEAPHLQDAIRHAQQAVHANQLQLRELLEARTAVLRQGERRRDLERFEHCLDIATGRRQFVTAKPLGLPFPRLPAINFFDREDFPWARAVEAATPGIIEELQAVSSTDAGGFTPYVQTSAGEAAGQFSELDNNADWSAYFLWKHGQRIDAHCERCPRTVAAVEQAPLVHVRGRAPAVMFSRLKPGTAIPPHHGATNTRLTVHLPLVIPNDCALRVGDETREWRPQELLIFDDTIRHEAWNRSNSQRVVLIFDVWHPMLTLLERELVTLTVEGLADYYEDSQALAEL